MNDRQMIELAAKAAGYQLAEYCSNKSNKYYIPDLGCIKHWDPLDFDDDAFRLLVKLQMKINLNGFCHWGAVTDVTTPWHIERKLTGVHPEAHGDDAYSATRRAIVRAAAEIGASMQGKENEQNG